MNLRTASPIFPVALLTVLVCAAAPALKPYVSQDGQFEVQLPGEPKEEQASRDTFQVKAMAGKPLISYQVSWTVMDSPVEKGDETTVLRLAREGLLKRLDAKVLSERPVTLQGKYPGTELKLEFMGLEMNYRAYVTRERLYQLSLVGDPGQLSRAELDGFFNSFKLRQPGRKAK